MQEFSILSQAFNQLLLQIPILIAGIVGLILLGRSRTLLGPANLTALIGVLGLIGLSIIGPFYQAWITKMVVERGASGNILLVSAVLLNLFWAIALLLLIVSIVMGRAGQRDSPPPRVEER